MRPSFFRSCLKSALLDLIFCDQSAVTMGIQIFETLLRPHETATERYCSDAIC